MNQVSTSETSAELRIPRRTYTYGDVFCLFCCPPLPSSISRKLAFIPPASTYSYNCNGEQITFELTERAQWQLDDEDRAKIDAFYARTRRRNKIACLFIRGKGKPKYTILYSHGNAVDIGIMCNYYLALASVINCNIFGYDYSGYGISTGTPSEKNVNADIEAACGELQKRYQIDRQNIILYGQSIGTVPTIDLASKHNFGGVILHSAFTSGVRLAFPNTTRSWFFDTFRNIDKITKVTSPTLIIHGTEDEIIDISHSLSIYENCPGAVNPLWIEGAGHNDIEMYTAYLERLKRFIEYELDHFNNAGPVQKTTSAKFCFISNQIVSDNVESSECVT